MKLKKLLSSTSIKLYDFLNKGEVSKIYNEIKHSHGKAKNWDSDLKKYLSSFSNDGNILNYPIINKADLWQYSKKVPAKSAYKKFSTGGSTGEPLTIPYSKRRTHVRTASALYYNYLGGYRPGAPYLFIRSKKEKWYNSLLKNELLFVPDDLSSESMNRLAERIHSRKVEIIIGYPSVIKPLSDVYMNNFKLKDSVKSFISTSEVLEQDVSLSIQKYMGVNVINRYSNEENGIIAQSEPNSEEMIVTNYNLFVEVLNEKNERVAEGEKGKIVVTDIACDTMPMIRYDTADLGVVSKYNSDGSLYSLERIEGRSVDYFIDNEGKYFSPLLLGPYIRVPLQDHVSSCQFQVIQISRSQVVVKLITAEEPSEVIIEKIKDNLGKVFGDRSEIVIEFVDNLYMLPSGKRPLYVNLVNQQC